MILLVIGTAGALMIVPISQGGEQVRDAIPRPNKMRSYVLTHRIEFAAVGWLCWHHALHRYDHRLHQLKRLQIDQHRAWMLRVWTWASSIASLRLIVLAAIHICETQ